MNALARDDFAVVEVLARTRNPYEVANLLKLSLSTARKVVREADDNIPGWGKQHLQQHIISRRRVNDRVWPKADEFTFIEMRRLHDQGRVTMCQGRDGDWIIQYAIQSQRPIKRGTYFYGS